MHKVSRKLSEPENEARSLHGTINALKLSNYFLIYHFKNKVVVLTQSRDDTNKLKK